MTIFLKQDAFSHTTHALTSTGQIVTNTAVEEFDALRTQGYAHEYLVIPIADMGLEAWTCYSYEDDDGANTPRLKWERHRVIAYQYQRTLPQGQLFVLDVLTDTGARIDGERTISFPHLMVSPRDRRVWTFEVDVGAAFDSLTEGIRQVALKAYGKDAPAVLTDAEISPPWLAEFKRENKTQRNGTEG